MFGFFRRFTRARLVGAALLLAFTTSASASAGEVAVREMLDDLLDPSAWHVEQHEAARTSLTIEDNELLAEVTAIGTEAWHAQLFHLGLSVIEGEEYTIEFSAKADPPRSFTLSATATGPDDYGSLGLSERVDVVETWQDYKVTFTASSSEPARLPHFLLGDAVGKLWIKNLSMVGRAAEREYQARPLPDDWFPFPIAWDDIESGTATDVVVPEHKACREERPNHHA